ncbi:UNVERIFIED_CONTAM: hypothetical protein Sradi_5088600 [Sesamum radiatum]|uniref:Uncharacterized protein n=1 Tax=Sesamum radiatum TaxID=300843 RepID=A0AAW2M3M2_SESRA
MGEASTSKAKDKVAGPEKSETSSTAASTSSVPITPLGGVKERGRGFFTQEFRMMFAFIAVRRVIGKRSLPKLLSSEDINL